MSRRILVHGATGTSLIAVSDVTMQQQQQQPSDAFVWRVHGTSIELDKCITMTRRHLYQQAPLCHRQSQRNGHHSHHGHSTF